MDPAADPTTTGRVAVRRPPTSAGNVNAPDAKGAPAAAPVLAVTYPAVRVIARVDAVSACQSTAYDTAAVVRRPEVTGGEDAVTRPAGPISSPVVTGVGSLYTTKEWFRFSHRLPVPAPEGPPRTVTCFTYVS